MADHYIENESLRVGINEHGAEMVSIYKKNESREYMWSGDPDYWNRVSPVLFPFVGKLNGQRYTYNGVTYGEIPQHGFARDMHFNMVEKLDNTVFFELYPDDGLRNRYPFEFKLRIGYKVEGNTVHVMWTVENKGGSDMYFSIGGHPAFACPGGLDEYVLDFSNPALSTLSSGELNENGVLKSEKRDIAFESGVLSLNDALFEKDALIFDGKGIYNVTLRKRSGEDVLRLRFDVPQLGIWSPAGKHAPFVCIEPWFGRCDRDDFEGELKDRQYGNFLSPGHSFNKEYVIDIL